MQRSFGAYEPSRPSCSHWLAPPSHRPLSARRRKRPPALPPSRATIPDTTSLGALHYRYIGPEGNRTDAIAGVKGDPNVYYAGAASGGVWKTTDAGAHWDPIFDGEPVSSIGAIAVAPSDPNVVWVGTGESFIRSHISIGWGMYRSTDAGKTWAHVGLENTGRIARIAVDPTNPDRALVAALGHAYGPQPERGIFRTTDGGKTWERVLFVNDSTGGIDVLLDPSNPRTVYAAMWQIEIHTWGRTSGGAGSSIWKSTDGGTTWIRLRNGLPTRPFGKVGLGISAAMPQRIYAEVETGDGVPREGQPSDTGRLFRSDNAGKSWQLMSSDLQPAGRTAYYDRMGVEPDNPNEAYFLASNFTKTLDGGKTMIDVPREQVPRGDHHDIWFDPSNGDRFAVAHDGGLGITTTRGRTWHRIQLPIAQMYHVTVDNRVPYFVYGNKQDGESAMGPSQSKQEFFGTDAGIWRGEWRSVGGGESGWATPDTVDENLVWSSASGSGSVGGIVTRYDVRTRNIHEVEVWPQSTQGTPADSVKYRFQWTFPLTISPHDHNTVYVGSQVVHETTDGGKTWNAISPDLTRNDKSKQKISGGLTPDNIGVEYGDVVFAIAESPITKGEIWAGTNDGLVQLTRDGGKSWTNVTANIPGDAAVGHGEQHRAVALQRWHRVHHRRWTSGEQSRSVGLQDDGFRQELDADRQGNSEVAALVRARDSRGSHAQGTALPGHGERVVRLVQRWRGVAAAAERSSARAGVRSRRAAALSRSRGGDVRTWLLHPRRSHAARSVDARNRGEKRGAVQASRSVSLSKHCGSVHRNGRHRRRKEPAEGRADQFLDQAGTKDTTSKDSVTITIANAGGAIVRTLKAPAKAGINRTNWDLHSASSRRRRRFERAHSMRSGSR